MSKRQVAANLMIATCLFSAALPVLNAAAASKKESSSEVVAKVTSNSSQAKDSSSAKASDETKKTSDESKKTSAETSTDKIQTLTSQTMIINKIIAKQGTMAGSVGTDSGTNLDYKGINGSTFNVYDVTELMTTIIKEELKTDKTVKASDSEIDRVVDQTANKIDVKSKSETASASSQSGDSADSSVVSSSQSKDESNDKASGKDGASSSQATSSTASENSKSTASATDDSTDAALLAKINDLRKGDKLRELVAKRAEKLSGSQLKSVATAKTAHDDKLKHDGIARVKLPIDGKYHAYYVVNTDTPKETYATNADPIVIFTPVTNEDGLHADDFTIYPKSDSVVKPTPKTPKTPTTPEKVTKVPLYQTGAKQQSWFGNVLESIWNLF